MRTLNVRLLVIVLIVVAVLAGSTHLLHSFQAQRESPTFKIRAEAAWNDQPRRDKEALKLMVEYLSQKPGSDDLAAREEMGFWLVDSGRYTQAATNLEEVVRSLERQNPPEKRTSQDVDRLQNVRRKLIDVAMVQGRCADAIYHLKILHQELPRDVGVLNSMGRCLVNLHREDGPDGAIETFHQAVLIDPQRFDIYYQMAMTLRFPPVERVEDAEKCMQEMIAYWNKPPAKPAPLAAVAHHSNALWLSELGKYKEALEEAETTLTLVKDHPGALYVAGQAELSLGDFSKAEEYARRGTAASPQNYSMYTLMADILVRDDKREKAIEVLRQAVDAMPSKQNKANVLWNLANLYLDGRASSDPKDIAAAVDCMAHMREYGFSPVQMAFLDGRLLYANDDWKASLESFERVRPKLNEFPQLMKCLDYWTGYCYLQQGNPDQAIHAFRRALSFDKFYFKAHDGIAQIFLSNGQYKDAADEYKQAVAGAPKDFQAWLSWGRALVIWNSHRTSGQNWAQVREVLRQAAKLNPHDGQIPMLFAEVFAAEGKTDQAARLINDFIQQAPKGVEFFIAKANLAARLDHMDEAQKILSEAKARLGDQVPLRLTQSAYLLRQQGFRAGDEIEKLADDVGSFSLAEKTRLWSGLVANLLEIKEYDRAKKICKLIAHEQPHDALIRYRLLEMALGTHDARNPAASLAELDGVLDELDQIAGQGPLWLYGKAVRLMLESRDGKPELLKQALDYADKAQKQRVNWSRPDVLKGEIYRQMGNEEEALHSYLQASVNGDHDLEFIRLLLQMLYERQRYQEADQVIHRLDSSQTPLDFEAGKTETQIFAQGGDFNRAWECAKTAYDPNSDDYREHVWHGQVLKLLARRAQQEGHQDKLKEIAASGEESLRRACQIAPNAADPRVVLVQFLMVTNQKSKAQIAASDAEEMIPQASSPLAMGYIYEALGNPQKACLCFEKAVERNPDQPRALRMLADFYVRHNEPKPALPLIDRLLSGFNLSGAVKASESDLLAARRMKATILLGEGYPRLMEAIELADRNLASPLASNEDKRLKIRLLLTDPRRSQGPEVLSLCEDLVRTGAREPDPEDRFRLARLQFARGNWQRCREQMQKLVNGAQSSPRYLAAYVEMLLDQEDLNEAELWLNQLQRISPSQAVAPQADLLFRKKEWAKVPEYLADFIQQEKGVKERVDRMLPAAQLFENLGGRLIAPSERKLQLDYFDKARQCYETYVQQRPGNEMLLAGFHGRRGNVVAALDLLSRFSGRVSDLDLAVAAADAIRCEKITPQQLRQVEKVLTAAVAAHGQSIPLLTALTALKTSQGDFAAAEDVCRKSMAADPASYQAYNNLGVLLALSGKKPDEALRMVDRAIEMAGPQPLLLDSRAVVHLARNEATQALDDLQAISADKIEPVWLFHKARAMWMAGQYQEAAAALAQARNKGLDRGLIDPPERPFYDQLQQQMAKRAEQP